MRIFNDWNGDRRGGRSTAGDLASRGSASSYLIADSRLLQ